jgi:hypothetical protein
MADFARRLIEAYQRPPVVVRVSRLTKFEWASGG